MEVTVLDRLGLFYVVAEIVNVGKISVELLALDGEFARVEYVERARLEFGYRFVKSFFRSLGGNVGVDAGDSFPWRQRRC